MEPEQTPHPDGEAAVGNSGLPGTPASPVTTVSDAVSTQLRELQTAPTPTLSDDELRTALIATYRLVNQVEAAALHLVRALDDRPQAMPTCTAGKVAATFLVHALRLDPGQAAHDVAAARALDPDGAGVGVDTGTDPLDSAATSGLPEIGAALAAGDISRRHVDHAIGCLNRIDQDVLTHIDPDGIAGIQRGRRVPGRDGPHARPARVPAPVHPTGRSTQPRQGLRPQGPREAVPAPGHRRQRHARRTIRALPRRRADRAERDPRVEQTHHVDAMATVCERDHTGIHAGIWTITMINGVPWVIPPPWIDPLQRPRRNTLHDDEHAAHQLATHLGDQLTLDLGEEPP
ncbi:MAG: DUF222 domain-containing protein [Kineosporiaceae bacterium]|nr:DUF222 domain-containing protein [Kineosporiaceae bacterium]